MYVKDALVSWMRENRTTQRTVGLEFVQWGMNHTEHEAIKITPYEAVLGEKARMDLSAMWGLDRAFAVVLTDLRIAGVRNAHVTKITSFAALHATPAVHVIITIKNAFLSRRDLPLIPIPLMTKLGANTISCHS